MSGAAPPAADAAATPLARLDAAEVDYGGRTALGPLSLEVRPGEVTAMVGPSGCGKSTAFRLIAGLEAPTRGRVERRLGRGETAVVFQAPTLMPWATALANVALPLALAGVGGAEAEGRAAEALRRVGLGQALTLRPAELSGGMAMRASLARALVTRPKLLLLDEPFAALDEITRRRLADDVLALWEAERPAILFVTHNVEEAVYIGRRVLVLTGGPGRLHADVAVEAPPSPRAGFRTSAPFRETAEHVSALLEAGLATAEPRAAA